MSTTTTTTARPLKRRRASSLSYVLRLSTPSTSSEHDASSPSLQPNHCENENSNEPGPSSGRFILVNGVLTRDTKKRYKCTFAGCDKTYAKPSRLAEHERVHTGERPFTCPTCAKSFLRETHLTAHARSHLPASARPLACPESGCDKRFWTRQHLAVHEAWHRGEREPKFQCTEEGCTQAFAKHHQLRAHVCAAHRPPGTKAYQCAHAGCAKSFDTRQKLRAHVRVHDEHRYACPTCPSTFFPTWTALQAHMRAAHPPTCPYPACGGRRFAHAKGLRAHLRIHEEQAGDNGEGGGDGEGKGGEGRDAEGDEGHGRKRRKGGGEWVCEEGGCEKRFYSKKSLNVHTRVAHLGVRAYACPHAGCGRKFGYKHLVGRHVGRVHRGEGEGVGVGGDGEEEEEEEGGQGESEDSEQGEEEEGGEDEHPSAIDLLTGKAYAECARDAGKVRCPYPCTSVLCAGAPGSEVGQGGRVEGEGERCEYVFGRAYDLRRHLRAVHDMEAGREEVDAWVRSERSSLC
ncbi:hypothetical protein GLOTRDRAFT_82578 [Gloeophyllum trabeum ATCC 11539]|uniref:C2H2-type domain-containing protein n=1 Tax=Gloeophyllum trabeum (strain ATCC 11539 / FP-39264 / Madison 617) TaxID=670483 RepID=S7PQM8_GLOTA|nr:uncharacterized protein GLOTRDRAFT_82578 [Gloeophyllum trabeum ATCC 11539]EPQ50116.1 hypothetical protein GLOTRDRAFT_82578 [Gloeophyllum trabeum ATCC 11539]